MGSTDLTLRVESITTEADTVISIVLTDPAGNDLRPTIYRHLSGQESTKP